MTATVPVPRFLFYIGAAVGLALLFDGRYDVSAQSVVASAQACYNACDTRWISLLTEAANTRSFLVKYQNSSEKAADYYCRTVATVTDCYDKCKTDFAQFFLDSRLSSSIDLAKSAAFVCTTDEAKCRAMDSRLWCNAYSPNLCGNGTTLSNEQCIRQVQAQRGCNFIKPAFRSQKVVMKLILNERMTCIQRIDYNAANETASTGIQTCSQYLPINCLAGVFDEQESSDSPYFSNSFKCSAISSAKDCISGSRTNIVQFKGQSYSMPCNFLPNSSEVISDLNKVLSSLEPSVCPPETNIASSTTFDFNFRVLLLSVALTLLKYVKMV